jgi:EmrB/QacA subfamily drug resistance transporter
MESFMSDRSYRWVVLFIVILGTFMAILDSSIVNVALPHMMSAFGVNRDQIEWVSTAFMLSLAVTMTTVGWLVKRIGHKALYLVSLFVFTIGSALCAFAWSYDSMIAARVIQAIGGGAIQPVGMSIVSEIFAPEERGKALGFWGTGVMVGPAIGPTLGGYLSDWIGWRSIFSVNLPFGALTMLAALVIMRSDRPARESSEPFDLSGFISLAMALIGGLIAFSEGQEKGWGSAYILTCFACSFAGFVMFIAFELSTEHPLLDLGLFRNRNFSLGMSLSIFRAIGLFGGIFLLPIFLENLLGYTTIQTGLIMMPGAIAVGVMMPVGGALADRYSPRFLVAGGALITGLSLFMFGRLDPSMTRLMIVTPQVIRGIGLALMMAPLINATIGSVPRTQVASASSFLNIAQTFGGAFGIALLNTCVTNLIHIHAVRLGGYLGPRAELFARLSRENAFARMPNVPALAGGSQDAAMALTGRILMHKANVIGFDNGFVIAGAIVLMCIPLCLMLKPLEHHSRKPSPALPSD